MKYLSATRYLSLIGTVMALGACADLKDVTGPSATAPPDPSTFTKVFCSADTRAGTVSCEPESRPEGGLSVTSSKLRRLIVGGQGVNVLLTSTNIAVAADTFAFDVTVQNLIPQALGTTDGPSAPDSAGVRVFFASGPTSTGTGTVIVANPDGVGTFTATNQPYYQYNEVLVEGDTTAAKRWIFQFTPDVTNFEFLLYVATAVRFPDGYVEGTPSVISLDPNETRTLTGTPRSVTGKEVLGETVTWVTSDTTIAGVSGDQVTAGSSNGFATLTASSGVRPALYPTYVSVCQSTVVANGALVSDAIETTDCFSTYGSPAGQPTTDFYADLYRVTLTAGQTVTVTMASVALLDTYLLLASPGTGFVVSGDDNSGGGVQARMEYTATETGVYVIEATTAAALDAGAYTLGVTIS